MPETWVRSAEFAESISATMIYLTLLAPKVAAAWRRFWQWNCQLDRRARVLIIYSFMWLLVLAVLIHDGMKTH